MAIDNSIKKEFQRTFRKDYSIDVSVGDRVDLKSLEGDLRNEPTDLFLKIESCGMINQIGYYAGPCLVLKKMVVVNFKAFYDQEWPEKGFQKADDYLPLHPAYIKEAYELILPKKGS